MRTNKFLVTAALAALCAMAVVFASCATAGVARIDQDENLNAGQFAEAYQSIDKQKPSYVQYKDMVSFYLDKGLLAFYAEDYKESAKNLLEAERLIDEAFTKDISDNFEALIKQDHNKRDYSGEDYENMYIQVFNALNFYKQGNLESALVEIRKMNEKLRYITDEYANQTRTIREKVGDFMSTTKELEYSNSALARYLGILFWRANGNLDSARIDSEELAKAFAAYPEIYKFPVPPSVVLRNGANEETNIPAGMARLNILSFAGLSPVKEVRPDEFLSNVDSYGSIALQNKYLYKLDEKGRRIGGFRSVFPWIMYGGEYRDGVLETMTANSGSPTLGFYQRGESIDRITVALEGGATFSLSLIEDMSVVMGTLIERRETRKVEIANKLYGIDTILRLLPGTGHVMVLVDIVVPFGDWRTYPRMTGVGGNENYIRYWTEWDRRKAGDYRMSRYFPNKAFGGGINLRPGTYSFTVNYYSGNKLVNAIRHKDVQVKAGQLNLVQSLSLK